MFSNASNLEIHGGNFNNVGHNQYIFYGNETKYYGIPAHKITHGAIYNSQEHQNVRRCLPGTREDVMDKLYKWASSGQEIFFWLSGPAGSGKSTIAHTLAHQFKSENKLAGTFFFSRSYADRTNVANIFPTLAYQLAVVFPAVAGKIEAALRQNPLILTQRLEAQLKELILVPLSSTPSISNTLVILDALDECRQQDCIDLVDALTSCQNHSLQIRFLLTSRREEYIEEELSGKFCSLDLWNFSADNDICTFLKTHFSRVYAKKRQYMTNIELPWPSDTDIKSLVQKSEGLFIYASTLISFLEEKHQPHKYLEQALTQHHGLDSLYLQVLRSYGQDMVAFKDIIGALLSLQKPIPITALAQLLYFNTREELNAGDIRKELIGCGSILQIPQENEEPIQLYHASLRDFFLDKERSQVYNIDGIDGHMLILKQCLMILCNLANLPKARDYAGNNWYHHMAYVIDTNIHIEFAIYDEWVGHLQNLYNHREYFSKWMDTIRFSFVRDDLVQLVSKIQKDKRELTNLQNRICDLLHGLEKEDIRVNFHQGSQGERRFVIFHDIFVDGDKDKWDARWKCLGMPPSPDWLEYV